MDEELIELNQTYFQKIQEIDNQLDYVWFLHEENLFTLEELQNISEDVQILKTEHLPKLGRKVGKLYEKLDKVLDEIAYVSESSQFYITLDLIAQKSKLLEDFKSQEQKIYQKYEKVN